MWKWIKELRKTERGRIKFKLSLYMFFFISVFLLVALTNVFIPPKYDRDQDKQNEEKIEETVELTYFQKQEKLLKNDYDYDYKINGEKPIEFIGESKNGIITGYRESHDSLIKYSIENGLAYRLTMDEKVEYPDFYAGLDEELFNLEKLFNKLNQSSAIIEKSDGKKIYTYNKVDEYLYKIITNEKEIKEINIKNDLIEYVFKYNY